MHMSCLKMKVAPEDEFYCFECEPRPAPQTPQQANVQFRKLLEPYKIKVSAARSAVRLFFFTERLFF